MTLPAQMHAFRDFVRRFRSNLDAATATGARQITVDVHDAEILASASAGLLVALERVKGYAPKPPPIAATILVTGPQPFALVVCPECGVVACQPPREEVGATAETARAYLRKIGKAAWSLVSKGPCPRCSESSRGPARQ